MENKNIVKKKITLKEINTNNIPHEKHDAKTQIQLHKMENKNIVKKKITLKEINTNNIPHEKHDAQVGKKRAPIPPAKRNEVWENHFGNKLKDKCPICNRNEINANNFECGHIVSVANNGSNSPDNMVPICGSCNKSMGKKNMIDYAKEHYPNAPLLSKIDVQNQINTVQKSLIQSREDIIKYFDEFKRLDRDELWSTCRSLIKLLSFNNYGISFHEFIKNLGTWENMKQEEKEIIRKKFGGDDQHIWNIYHDGINYPHFLLDFCQNNGTYEDIIMYAYRKIDTNNPKCREFIEQMEKIMKQLEELVQK
jgi:5-methylcytosine-specific restriction endonuclease McrA